MSEYFELIAEARHWARTSVALAVVENPSDNMDASRLFDELADALEAATTGVFPMHDPEYRRVYAEEMAKIDAKTGVAAQSFARECLIATASWWAGWCADHDSEIPDLAELGSFLLSVKHQMALDRPTTVATKEGRS